MDNKEYRLLPVALHPAIEEALKRHCMMPNTAWQDVIAAADRVGVTESKCEWPTCECVLDLDNCKARIPERSGKTADEDNILQAAQERMWDALSRRACPGPWMQIASDAIFDFKVDSYGSMLSEDSAPAASSSAAPSDERKGFEAFIADQYPNMPLAHQVRFDGTIEYKSAGTEHRWKGWLARALATPSVQAVAAGQEWQPIETAPKDQEVWAFNGEQARMVWSEGDCWALWLWADELLQDADPSPDQPTHWKPLPKPPALAGDTKAGE